MQQTYIVIFETKKTKEVREYLKTYGTYSPITKNSWAIRSAKGAALIRNEMKKHVDPGDKIFIVRSGVEAAWRNQADANSEWLKKYL